MEETIYNGEKKVERDEQGRIVSGVLNPNGRPKGQTLKEYWRERFKLMTDEEKLEFTQKVGNEAIWKMAEGLPKADVEISGELTEKIISIDE